jgi:hypothetical protein
VTAKLKFCVAYASFIEDPPDDDDDVFDTLDALFVELAKELEFEHPSVDLVKDQLEKRAAIVRYLEDSQRD